MRTYTFQTALFRRTLKSHMWILSVGPIRPTRCWMNILNFYVKHSIMVKHSILIFYLDQSSSTIKSLRLQIVAVSPNHCTIQYLTLTFLPQFCSNHNYYCCWIQLSNWVGYRYKQLTRICDWIQTLVSREKVSETEFYLITITFRFRYSTVA